MIGVSEPEQTKAIAPSIDVNRAEYIETFTADAGALRLEIPIERSPNAELQKDHVIRYSDRASGIERTSLPTYITGPDGCPVGDPPSGSKLTANVAFI